MAEILPLRGIRFDPTRSGPIGPLISPPYDVVMDRGNGAEYSISAIENVDLGASGDQHALAARRYHDWLAVGTLRRDAVPAIYIHRHKFLVDGVTVMRTGLFARVRLRNWDEQVILPHERTLPGPRLERLERLHAVGANLSPLYFLFRDEAEEMRDQISKMLLNDSTSGEVRDRMGSVHQLVPVTDPEFHDRVEQFFADRTVFVADGHHRYEAALAYRDEMRRRFPVKDGPWEYVLALLAAVEDPGVKVLPTHRLLTGGPPIPSRALLEMLGRWFDVSGTSCFPGDDRNSALFRLVLPDSLLTSKFRPLPGNPHLALLPRDRGSAWRDLGVSALEGILESIVGSGPMASERRITPMVSEDTAIAHVREGLAHAAFLLPAPSLDRLLAVAEQGDLLPPKSTWFEPKAPAGLVISGLTHTYA